MFLLQLLHETGMPDLYPFIGLIILHVIISGGSLILHKVFEKQEKITIDATKIDGVMKKEDIAIKVDIFVCMPCLVNRCLSFCPFSFGHCVVFLLQIC